MIRYVVVIFGLLCVFGILARYQANAEPVAPLPIACEQSADPYACIRAPWPLHDSSPIWRVVDCSLTPCVRQG